MFVMISIVKVHGQVTKMQEKQEVFSQNSHGGDEKRLIKQQDDRSTIPEGH